MLAGNVVAIGLSALVCIVVSFIRPQNYDWALMKEIPMVEDDPNAYTSDGEVSGAMGLDSHGTRQWGVISSGWRLTTPPRAQRSLQHLSCLTLRLSIADHRPVCYTMSSQCCSLIMQGVRYHHRAVRSHSRCVFALLSAGLPCRSDTCPALDLSDWRHPHIAAGHLVATAGTACWCLHKGLLHVSHSVWSYATYSLRHAKTLVHEMLDLQQVVPCRGRRPKCHSHGCFVSLSVNRKVWDAQHRETTDTCILCCALCSMWIVIALTWGLLASACCIFYPIWEARDHIMFILGHLVKCQTVEPRDEAVLHTVKDVMPPEVRSAMLHRLTGNASTVTTVQQHLPCVRCLAADVV